MATITKFEDLHIWKVARELSLEIFRVTQSSMVLSKDFRFLDQTRSAAGSVMDNIAEGFERSSRLEFVNFLSIAKGSAGEVRSQLYRAIDQDYLQYDEGNALMLKYEALASELGGFIKYLNTSEYKGQKFKDRLP